MENFTIQSAFRLFVLAGLLVNGITLLCNLLQTYDTFNPSYCKHYLLQQCLRPFVGIVVFVVVLLLEVFLLGWLAA